MASMDSRSTIRNPAYQGYLLLRTAFVLAPILFGLDSSSTSWSSGRTTWRRGSTG